MAENTNNNTENLREKLSEMDKIFVPKDLDSDGSLSDYTEYKVKFFNFKTVPENCVLITKNIFTGKVRSKGGRGLKFMLPLFTKSILVSTVDRTIDYEKIEYLTKDGVMANVDMAIVVKITDPEKYITKGKEQLDQLNILIKRLLRVYVSNKNFDVLSQGECLKYDFDPNLQLKEFEEKYGIAVSKIIFKEVKLPERLQKLYNDQVEAQQQRKAQKERLEAEKEKAQMEAEIVGIKAEAEAKRIQKIEEAKADVYLNKMKNLVTYLKSQNVPTEGIADFLKTQMISENQNASFFMGGTDQSRNIAAGVAAGNAATRKNNQNTFSTTQQQNLSNTDKILNTLFTYVSLGQYSTESYAELKHKLQSPEMRSKIDNLPQEECNNLIKNLLEVDNNRIRNYQSDEDQTINRPRR